jgi:hypothetical protein
LNRTFGSIAHWLSPSFGADFRLEPDLDRIEALSTERAALWQRVDSASFLDRNEKRQAVGYGVTEGIEADIAVVDMADEAGVDDAEAEINKLKAKLYDLEQKYPGQPRDHGRFSFGRGTTNNPPPSSGGSTTKPTSSGNVQVAVAPIQGIGWPSMNDASPQNAILSGDEANLVLVGSFDGTGYPINLMDEKIKGGHTIEDHVGKSDEQLKSNILREQQESPAGILYQQSDGSFTNLESATKLVNATISRNSGDIINFMRSNKDRLVITSLFESVTGREVYMKTPRSEPYIRETYNVKIVLKKDKNNGFYVLTAFPTNQN